MEVRVYATLRDIVKGKSIEIETVPEMTASQMLERVLLKYPALHDEIFDKEGNLGKGIHVFINGRDVRYLDGLETRIKPEDSVRLFPPVGGGV